MVDSDKVKGKLLLQRFGRYLILDHLVDGGMAKICRARFLGEEADKIVAIKMIQTQFSNDEAFKKMFMDEIKVTFGLIHPNITQTFDYGEENGQLYQVMEYVHGRNLKEYLDKLKNRGFVFPVEVSVYIISQACQGLHYAHTFKNSLTGESAHIIHRDISPHNLMLTYDGALKVIDFGIAKANSNSDKTQAGTIKGKLSYLAPEYLEGADLDPSYDQFALGITLWEMLCCRKLFTAKTDLAVLKKIQACKVPPPSTINPNVPKELDQIVLQALAKDRSLRYENLDQLNRALTKFLYSTYPDFNATDLAYFAKELFKDEITRDNERFIEFGKIDLLPYLKDLKTGGSGGANVSSVVVEDDAIIIEDDVDDKDSGVSSTRGVKELDFGFSDQESAGKEKALKMEKRVSRGHDPVDPFNISVQPARKSNPNDMKKKWEDRTPTGDRTETRLKKSFSRKSPTQMEVKSSKRYEKSNASSSMLSTRRRSKTHDSNKMGALGKITSLAACVALLWFGYNSRCKLFKIDCASQVASTCTSGGPCAESKVSSEVNRQPASMIEIDSASWRNYQMLFTDLSKKPRIYLNDKVLPGLDQNFSGRILNVKFLPNQDNYLRVVYDDDHEFFVQRLEIDSGLSRVTIPSIHDVKKAEYGYLTGGQNCRAKGFIEFSLFGETRSATLPIVMADGRTGIAFPLGRHYIEYRGDAQGMSLKPVNITIEIKKRDDLIDICDHLPDPSTLDLDLN